MRVVLVALTLNHFIYLYFENFIEGVMNNASTAGQAPGYGIVYALLIFPFQLFFELVCLQLCSIKCSSSVNGMRVCGTGLLFCLHYF